MVIEADDIADRGIRHAGAVLSTEATASQRTVREHTIKAIRIHRNGERDEMKWEDIDLPAPAAGEVRVRHAAIVLNFSDVNVRRSAGAHLESPPEAPWS